MTEPMIKKVAEAIWRADDPERAITGGTNVCPKYYRDLAQAAIDALRLAEELRMVSKVAGVTVTKTRLVTPWVEDQP